MTEVWEGPNKLSSSSGNSIFRNISSLTPVTSWLYVKNGQLSRRGNLSPTLPPEAKLLAQRGLWFTKVLYIAWGFFTDVSANHKPESIRPQDQLWKNRISLCSESRTENCVLTTDLSSKLLFCHSHVISHIVTALEGNVCHVSSFLDRLQSVNSMPFIAKATQQWAKS